MAAKMKYLNLVANAIVVGFFTWQSSIPDAYNWIDFSCLICFSAITGIEIERDLGKND